MADTSTVLSTAYFMFFLDVFDAQLSIVSAQFNLINQGSIDRTPRVIEFGIKWFVLTLRLLFSGLLIYGIDFNDLMALQGAIVFRMSIVSYYILKLVTDSLREHFMEDNLLKDYYGYDYLIPFHFNAPRNLFEWIWELIFPAVNAFFIFVFYQHLQDAANFTDSPEANKDESSATGVTASTADQQPA